MSGAWRSALGVAAVVTAALGLWTARVVWQSRAELRRGESELASGDAAEGVATLGRAARLHAPGNPFSRAALEELRSIAQRAEGRAERDEALLAWREIRSALRATRWSTTSDPGLAAEADARIAALAAALEGSSMDAGAAAEDEPARRAWHAARLAEDDAPSPAFSLLALLGLVLWVGSAFGLLSRGLDERLRPVRRPALLFSAGIALGLALFLVGLARA